MSKTYLLEHLEAAALLARSEGDTFVAYMIELAKEAAVRGRKPGRHAA